MYSLQFTLALLKLILRGWGDFRPPTEIAGRERMRRREALGGSKVHDLIAGGRVEGIADGPANLLVRVREPQRGPVEAYRHAWWCRSRPSIPNGHPRPKGKQVGSHCRSGKRRERLFFALSTGRGPAP